MLTLITFNMAAHLLFCFPCNLAGVTLWHNTLWLFRWCKLKVKRAVPPNYKEQYWTMSLNVSLSVQLISILFVSAVNTKTYATTLRQWESFVGLNHWMIEWLSQTFKKTQQQGVWKDTMLRSLRMIYRPHCEQIKTAHNEACWQARHC